MRRSRRLIVKVLLFAASTFTLDALLVGPTVGEDNVPPSRPKAFEVTLDRVASGLESAVLLVGAADGSGQRYVVEQAGRIMRIDGDGALEPEPFLDITSRVLHDDERGLLGLAFHSDFAENGRFFVSYSRRDDGATSISEFSVPGSPTTMLNESEEQARRPVEQRERPLLVIAQPYTSHKGGMLAFDRDGMLLISTGDGGAAWDPHEQAQDPASLLGKMLRIDVDKGWPYAIPPDNGFADLPGARGEVHAIGLRNPWRFSIDDLTGDIYIGDVGQDAWEEIDVLHPGERGVSFGWDEMDTTVCLVPEGCGASAHRLPAIVYPHVDGDTGHCAVVGGFAYRGEAGSLPQGIYLYSDWCSGTIWAVPADRLDTGDASPLVVAKLDPDYGLAQGFGQDDAGELYLLTSGGFVMHIRSTRSAA